MKHLVVLHRAPASREKIPARIAAYGLTRVAATNIEAKPINPGDFAEREAFDSVLLSSVTGTKAIVLAAYMRILSTAFVARFFGRMLNVHPSLLPHYPGLHRHHQAMRIGPRPLLYYYLTSPFSLSVTVLLWLRGKNPLPTS